MENFFLKFVKISCTGTENRLASRKSYKMPGYGQNVACFRPLVFVLLTGDSQTQNGTKCVLLLKIAYDYIACQYIRANWDNLSPDQLQKSKSGTRKSRIQSGLYAHKIALHTCIDYIFTVFFSAVNNTAPIKSRPYKPTWLR